MIDKEDLRGIQGIVHRFEHLKQNVARIDFGDNHTYKSTKSHKFDHSIWITLTLKTTYLWENARSYVWKHLGQNEWKTSDGTRVTMNRIHMKT